MLLQLLMRLFISVMLELLMDFNKLSSYSSSTSLASALGWYVRKRIPQRFLMDLLLVQEIVFYVCIVLIVNDFIKCFRLMMNTILMEVFMGQTLFHYLSCSFLNISTMALSYHMSHASLDLKYVNLWWIHRLLRTHKMNVFQVFEVRSFVLSFYIFNDNL